MRSIALPRTMLGAAMVLALLAGCDRVDKPDEGLVEDMNVDEAVVGDEAPAAAEADEAPVDAPVDAPASNPAVEDEAASDESDGAMSSGAEPGRIVFEPGTEGGIVTGDLEGAGDRDQYVLRALAGQEMSLRLRGVSNGAIAIEVAGGEGSVMGTSADATGEDLNRLVKQLPESGDYRITLTAAPGAPSLSYELELRVTGEGRDEVTEAEDPADADETDQADDGMTPVTVVFDPGTSSTTHDGSVDRGDIVTYNLRASAGQRMTLEFESSPEGSVDVMVFDPDRNPMRAMRDPAGPYFELRETGDFAVTVSNPATDGEVDYAITFGIADGADSADETGDAGGTDAAVATQLFFAPGETETTVQGVLSADEQDRYALTAAGDQTMRVTLEAEDPSLFQVYIEDMGGNVLVSGLEGDSLETALPRREDYTVTILARPGAPASTYSLSIAID